MYKLSRTICLVTFSLGWSSVTVASDGPPTDPSIKLCTDGELKGQCDYSSMNSGYSINVPMGQAKYVSPVPHPDKYSSILLDQLQGGIYNGCVRLNEREGFQGNTWQAYARSGTKHGWQLYPNGPVDSGTLSNYANDQVSSYVFFQIPGNKHFDTSSDLLKSLGCTTSVFEIREHSSGSGSTGKTLPLVLRASMPDLSLLNWDDTISAVMPPLYESYDGRVVKISMYRDKGFSGPYCTFESKTSTAQGPDEYDLSSYGLNDQISSIKVTLGYSEQNGLPVCGVAQ